VDRQPSVAARTVDLVEDGSSDEDQADPEERSLDPVGEHQKGPVTTEYILWIRQQKCRQKTDRERGNPGPKQERTCTHDCPRSGPLAGLYSWRTVAQRRLTGLQL
jgi:hypothetical protein